MRLSAGMLLHIYLVHLVPRANSDNLDQVTVLTCPPLCVRERLRFSMNGPVINEHARHLIVVCVCVCAEEAARLCVRLFYRWRWCAVGGGTGRNRGRGGGGETAADERSSEADRRVVFPVWRCWTHVEEVEGRLRKAASSPSPRNGFYLLSPRKNVYSVLYLAGEQQYSTLCSLSGLWAELRARSAVVLPSVCLLLSRSAEWRLWYRAGSWHTTPATFISQRLWKCDGRLSELTLQVGALKSAGRQREEATSHNVSQQREQHSSYLLSAVPSSLDVRTDVCADVLAGDRQTYFVDTAQRCVVCQTRWSGDKRLLVVALTNINAHLSKQSGTLRPPRKLQNFRPVPFLTHILCNPSRKVLVSFLVSLKCERTVSCGNCRLLVAHPASLVVSPRK